MNFAIEVPSEANPLNIQALVNVLTKASSTDQQQVQTSTQQLQNWERQPGFYSSLQSVFIETSLPLEVRYLSSIQLKNGIDKYWRKTASNAISKEEKTLIRSRCLDSGINEPDRRLALQNALVIAKITRFDFPHDWPDVISSVTEHLRLASRPESNSVHLSRTLLIVLYIIKELSTARLQRSRSSLQSATPEVFQVLGQVYVENVHLWMRNLQNGTGNHALVSQAVAESLLALRVLRRLAISGFEFPNRHKEVQEFWVCSRLHLAEMLSLLRQHRQSLQLEIQFQIEKILVQLSKLHLEMVKVHPAAFALLPDSPELAKAYWRLLCEFGQTFGSQSAVTPLKIGADGDSEDKDISYMEKVSLKGLLLIRACAKMVYSPSQTFKYQHAEDKAEKKQSIALMQAGLLSEALIGEMMEILVTRFFVFRPRDLREWEAEPDEWERREEGEGDVWEFSIRSCAEKLFLDLVINNKDRLTKPLLNVFYTVATPQNSDVLLKDSIYAAIGLAAPVLETELDFGKFLEITLVPEIQIQGPGYNVLRRRIAIVLGQWLMVKEGLNRPLVYQIFQYLLDKADSSNDLVVRVTAGRQLKNIIEPYEFTAEPFMPFAPVLLGRLMALIEEVELSETKMALLHTVNVILSRMEHHITPFAEQVLSLLPSLWSQAGEEYLMKQSILGILSVLMTSVKEQSHRFHAVILPLVESSIELASESRTYLLEDALDLWAALLAQTPGPTPAILALVEHLFPMYDSATDTLRKALEITESYILLAPGPMLDSSARFLAAFAALLAARPRREASGIITRLVELLIQSADTLGGPPAIQALTPVLLSSQLLPQLLTSLHAAHAGHQTSGPHRHPPAIDPLVETSHLSVLARLTLGDPSSLTHALSTLSSPSSFDTTITWLLDEWFAHFENIGSPDTKKLHCLALSALLAHSPAPWIMRRLQSLMTVWTDVIADCVEPAPAADGDDDDDNPAAALGAGRDTLVWADPDGLKPTDRPEAPEDARKRHILFADPVHRVDVRDFVRDRLRRCVEACEGPEAFRREWLVDVDADVVGAFGRLGVW
ncbi:hypothetical protein MMC26_006629 [Xylographa opegraphella]|nr:hypothetical protein [Xylographa opegraphella]